MGGSATYGGLGATYRGGGGAPVAATVPVPGGAGITDAFTPATGQTDFVLTQPPGGGVAVVVNGQFQIPGDDYTLVGQALVWTSSDFTLTSTDNIQIWY